MDDSNRRRRVNSSQKPLTPVPVPSAAYLDEMAQKRAPEASVSQSANPSGDRNTLRKADALTKKMSTTVTITPSKAFLEEQAERRQEERERAEREREERELAKKQKHQSYEDFAPISTTTPSKCQIEELREKGRSEDMLSNIRQVPSKAYLEEQEEKIAQAQVPLKSALKKTSSLKPTLKSILKKSPVHDEPKAYSEDESAKHVRDHRSSLQVPKAFARHSTAPSVVPPVEEMQRGWSSRYAEPAIRAPVHEIHPSTLRPIHSTSTGSTDSAGHDYHRSRAIPVSNYVRPYIREIPPEVIHKPQSPTHVDLSWPLVEYNLRKAKGQPLITFDAGFNPRHEKYSVRAFRPGDYVSTPLSRQESVMQLSETAFVNWIVITCDKLPLWPIQLQQTTNLRVIDIFRAIYDTFAQPLTQEEFMYFGRDTIRRCEAAFQQRCEDGPDLAFLAEKKGMLRIDLLRGRRIFKGLYPDRGKVGHYKLLFDDGPRRL
jgi:hypothetical protein